MNKDPSTPHSSPPRPACMTDSATANARTTSKQSGFATHLGGTKEHIASYRVYTYSIYVMSCLMFHLKVYWIATSLCFALCCGLSTAGAHRLRCLISRRYVSSQRYLPPRVRRYMAAAWRKPPKENLTRSEHQTTQGPLCCIRVDVCKPHQI